MNLYDRYLLPYLTDFACGLRSIDRQRAKVVPQACGRVLEIGLGTGHNLRHYDCSRIIRLSGLEPAARLHRLAERRARGLPIDLNLLAAEAEAIPAPDASFDTVVTTFTLCTIAQPVRALREMRRVLAPAGRLLFCEHGLAPDSGIRRWQDRLNRYWKPLAGGCNLDREIPDLLRAGGFEIGALNAAYLPGPKVLTYNYWGVARAPG